MRTPAEKAAGLNLTMLRCPQRVSNKPRSATEIVLGEARKEVAKAYPKRSPTEWALLEPNVKYHWRGPSGPMFHLMSLEEIKQWEFRNLELGGPTGLYGPPTPVGFWPIPKDNSNQVELYPLKPKAAPPSLPVSDDSGDSDDTVVVQVNGERAEPRISLREAPSYDFGTTEVEHASPEAPALNESGDGGTGSSQFPPVAKFPTSEEIWESSKRVERRRERNLRNLERNRQKVDELGLTDRFRAKKYQKRVERAERDIALIGQTKPAEAQRNTFAVLETSEEEVEPIPGLYNDAVLGAHYKNVPSDLSDTSDEDGLEHYRDRSLGDLFNTISQATGADTKGVDGFPPWGAVTWSGDCSEALGKEHPERGKIEWATLNEFAEECGTIPLDQPTTLVMKGWSAAQKYRALAKATCTDPTTDPVVRDYGMWAKGPPSGLLRVRMQEGASPAWEDTNARLLDLIGPLELIGAPPDKVVFPLSPFFGEVSSPRELFPLGVPVTRKGADLWWWCYNRAFFLYIPDCPLGTNNKGVWTALMFREKDKDRAQKLRRILERASVDLANWAAARITVDRHLKQVNQGHKVRVEEHRIAEEDIRDVRVREVIEGYNLGRSSDLYSPRGFRPLPYHSDHGVVSRNSPYGDVPTGHGGVSRRLPPEFRPFARPAIGSSQ